MNFSNIRSYFFRIMYSTRAFFQRCGSLCVNQRCQVHPESLNPEDLQLINLGAQRNVRVIHISQDPGDHIVNPCVIKHWEEVNSKNEAVSGNFDISTEEYWFARSSRPFKTGEACDCFPNTFTSSPQFPKALTVNSAERCNEIMYNSTYDYGLQLLSTKRQNKCIENFAEDFVSATLIEALVHPMRNLEKSSNKYNLDNTPSVLNLESTCDSVLSNDKEEIHNSPNVNSVSQADTHTSQTDSSMKLRMTEIINYNEDNKTVVETSFDSYNGGIVNKSFEGTMSEPDALPCGDTDYSKNCSGAESSEVSDCLCDDKGKFPRREYDAACVSPEYQRNLTLKESSQINIKVVNSDKESDFNGSKTERFEDSIMSSRTVETENSKDIQRSCLTISRSEDANGDAKIKSGSDCCKHSRSPLKPILLFLHGAGSSADVWSVLLGYFSSAGYEVVAPDMLGHGYSSAPNNRSAYTFDKLLQDVLQIFDRFVSDHQKCIVIGHSYGSCFAAALARYRPLQVVQLVLLSSGGPSPLVPKQAFFSLPSCVMSFMKPFLMCGFKRELFYAPRGKHLPPSCTYELPPYVLKHMECGQEWAQGDSAFHRRILVPTLLVHGLKDPYISLVEECEMERTIPRSFLEVISNAGHMIMLDTPEQLCHMIHSFIAWWNS